MFVNQAPQKLLQFVGVTWHGEWGWAWFSSNRQTSPALQVPKQVALFTWVGCLSGIHATPADTASAPRRTSHYIIGRTTPRFPTASPSLCPAPQTPIVGHVSLWDRLPPLQVDLAPAAALRHYFWHNRHRRHLWMGRGRGRQVSLRQYVGPVPRQERPVGEQVAHGVL